MYVSECLEQSRALLRTQVRVGHVRDWDGEGRGDESEEHRHDDVEEVHLDGGPGVVLVGCVDHGVGDSDVGECRRCGLSVEEMV